MFLAMELWYEHVQTGDGDTMSPLGERFGPVLIRQAAHEFAETGQRPTCVEWQTWDWPGDDGGSDWPSLEGI